MQENSVIKIIKRKHAGNGPKAKWKDNIRLYDVDDDDVVWHAAC
jgi:hypothetical protein